MKIKPGLAWLAACMAGKGMASKGMAGEEIEGAMLRRGLIGAVAASALACGPAWAGSNEAKWKSALEARIDNGAPASDICSDAKSSAAVSSDAAFIEYALGVARLYCDKGEIGDKKPGSPTQPQAEPKQAQQPQQQQQQAHVNGRLISTCSHGGLCLNQLREAMIHPASR